MSTCSDGITSLRGTTTLLYPVLLPPTPTTPVTSRVPRAQASCRLIFVNIISDSGTSRAGFLLKSEGNCMQELWEIYHDSYIECVVPDISCKGIEGAFLWKRWSRNPSLSPFLSTHNATDNAKWGMSADAGALHDKFVQRDL